MATKKTQKPEVETIACCRVCQRTHIMRGSPGQLRQQGALRCPRCKRALEVTMEVERL
jgi:hypothetical protein